MRLLTAIFIAMVVGLSACTENPTIDSRLLEADSILSAPRDFVADNQAAEAVRILDGIDVDALSPMSRAVDNIVRVYAFYRLDTPMTVAHDSLINEAISHINDRRFLSRAYAVKGMIAEDVDIPENDLAVRWYNLAATTMDTTDHALAGYVNMRIANFYQINAFVDTAKIISHYREALRHYSSINDTTRIAKCQYSLSFVYELVNADSCRHFANKALRLGIEHRDSSFIAQCYILLAGMSFDYGDYNAAVAYADEAALLGERYNPESEPLYYKAAAYSRLNMPDSAKYFVRQFPISDYETNIQSREFVAEVSGDYKTAHELLSQRYEMRDELLGGQLQQAMIKADLAFENQQLAEKNAQKSRTIMLVGVFAILIIATLVVMLFYRHFRQQQLLSLLEQIKEENEAYFADKSNFNAQISYQLKSLLLPISQLEAKTTSINEIKKSVVAKAREFLTEEFFADAEKFVNASNGNIIARINGSHQLTALESKVLILSCCGLKNNEIAILLDYTSPHSIENIKSRIASYTDSSLSLNKFIEANKTKK